MNLETFSTYVAKEIKNYLPEEYALAEVRLHDVKKNNGKLLKGITIVKEGRNISPTIYLNEFYHDYMESEDIETVMEEIARFRVHSEMQEDFMIDKITNYEYAKEKLTMRAINAEMNAELLKEVPHKRILDLAITFHIVVDLKRDGISSATVTNEILKIWGASIDEVYEAALEKMQEFTPAKFKSMSDILREMCPNSPIEDMEGLIPEEDTMYVLQSEIGAWGANNIADKTMLDTIRFLVESDYYILPSSVHELIIIPIRSNNPSVRLLQEMVRDVNDNQVAPEERLSYNVYKYTEEGLAIA